MGDWLLFGDLVINEECLIIPDPDIYKRSFISFPLFELNHDLIIPDKKMPITIVLRTLSNDHMIQDQPFTDSLGNMVKI
ncbi:MAG: hypothetical protein ACYSTS_14395 [Planctomycetota bacterium]|jgi:7,8-dihydro-6-hydroxymethylpterin-pyrophosphokinase